MSEVVEVLFKGEERELFTNPTPVILRPGDHVVVEADKGEDMGRVILKGMWVSKKAREAPVRKIIRKATKEDLERRVTNMEKEIEAFQVCRERIEERELRMKLVDVECRFDGNRITFYFTAEKRVDFRELVKDLAAIYRTRIELRQIGVRDEAKRIGGFGSCGRKFCCTTFLREFEPVTLKMAKDQHLSLSPTKISGACGRLMCCLMYEVDTYRQCLEGYPKVGSKIQVDGREVQVTRVDIFREGIFVQDPEGGEQYIPLKELGSGKPGWRSDRSEHGEARGGGQQEESGSRDVDVGVEGGNETQDSDLTEGLREEQGGCDVRRAKATPGTWGANGRARERRREGSERPHYGGENRLGEQKQKNHQGRARGENHRRQVRGGNRQGHAGRENHRGQMGVENGRRETGQGNHRSQGNSENHRRQTRQGNHGTQVRGENHPGKTGQGSHRTQAGGENQRRDLRQGNHREQTEGQNHRG